MPSNASFPCSAFVLSGLRSLCLASMNNRSCLVAMAASLTIASASTLAFPDGNGASAAGAGAGPTATGLSPTQLLAPVTDRITAVVKPPAWEQAGSEVEGIWYACAHGG